MPEHSQQLVYVVDDDQGMLDATVWLFESMGLKALPFTNGQAFLDACDPTAAACVLLDVRMPGWAAWRCRMPCVSVASACR